MPPPSEMKQLVKLIQLSQKRMAELTELFEQEMGLFAALIKGISPAQASAPTNDAPSFTEQGVTTAAATLAAQGVNVVPRGWLAIVARVSPKSSVYRTTLASLIKRGVFVSLPGSAVRISKTLEATPEAPVDWTELMQRFAKLFPQAEASIMSHLMIEAHDHPGFLMDRKTLAERTGQSMSSTFQRRISSLVALGFIEVGAGSTVRARTQWFETWGDHGNISLKEL